MPLARIDLSKAASAQLVRIVSEAVYEAMVDIAKVPPHDKFQVITRHEVDEIVYPEEGYLGMNYSRDLIIIQVTWVGGRSTEVKKQFFHPLAMARCSTRRNERRRGHVPREGMRLNGISLSSRISGGRPRTRSAMMLRSISSVPPSSRVAGARSSIS